ncbi:DUF4262 domain-containing protein [Lewinella sp. IMCC34183]|uniref:DUF4262 domain-containing protein n=1 Tax=Lewinella sp. IMCC34183 TaxID=2248762 RepID=UPI0013008CFC|nr:DUF4262 domain-containing protein [Lewinella sp. IMCC34183]
MDEAPYRHHRAAEAHIQNYVARFGWFIAVHPPNHSYPTRAYTIGLWNNSRHPEFFAAGLSPDELHGLLSQLAGMVRAGTPPPRKEFMPGLLRNRLVDLRELTSPSTWERLPYAAGYHGYVGFTAVEVAWSDSEDGRGPDLSGTSVVTEQPQWPGDPRRSGRYQAFGIR